MCAIGVLCRSDLPHFRFGMTRRRELRSFFEKFGTDAFSRLSPFSLTENRFFRKKPECSGDFFKGEPP